MDENLSIRVLGDVVVASIQDIQPTPDVNSLLEANTRGHRIAEFCRDRGIRRILYIRTIENEMSSMASHSFYDNLERFGLERSTRMAIVERDGRMRRQMEIGIKVANSKGWHVQLFADPDSGLQWLRQETGHAESGEQPPEPF